MSTPTPTLAATEESLRDIVATKYFFLASLTMMLYDHALTFPQEVQVIWKRKKTYISYLFFLVRYYSVLAMIVITFGFFSPELTREDCSHWMLFLPLGCTLVLTLLPGILMSIRVSAVYNGNPYLLCGLLTLLAAQAGAGLWQYTVKGGTPAPDPVDNYNFHFCIYLPPKSLGTRSIMYISMEVAFDSLVFLLTVARTTYLFLARTPRARLHREEGGGGTGSTGSEGQGSSLLLNLVRDGVFYFGAIFSINLAWVIMILHAPTGLRATAAIPGGCFMATMICRITINLRTTAYGPARLDERTGIPLSDLHAPPRSGISDSTTLGSLDSVGKIHGGVGGILPAGGGRGMGGMMGVGGVQKDVEVVVHREGRYALGEYEGYEDGGYEEEEEDAFGRVHAQ